MAGIPGNAPSSASQAAAARLQGVRPPGVRPTVVPDEAPGAGDAAKSKKQKRTRIIIACVVLLLVGYEVKGKLVKPHYGPGVVVPAGPIVSLGSVTTNLSDGHLAQIGVAMQMTAAANEKKEATLGSRLIGATVAIIGEQTYGSLLPASGRATLRAELLRAYQQALGPNEGAQQVSGVYFTSFVLQ